MTPMSLQSAETAYPSYSKVVRTVVPAGSGGAGGRGLGGGGEDGGGEGAGGEGGGMGGRGGAFTPAGGTSGRKGSFESKAFRRKDIDQQEAERPAPRSTAAHLPQMVWRKPGSHPSSWACVQWEGGPSVNQCPSLME